jgi:hypothetical protein
MPVERADIAGIRPLTATQSVAGVLQTAMLPERRYATLLTIGFVAVASWTVATTLYVDWMAYSPLPWGDHWDHWRRYIDENGLTFAFLFSPNNEHRIATSRVLFWIDLHFFAARNTFLYIWAVVIQAMHALLLWRLGRRTAGYAGLALPFAAVAFTATFASQQFTNFTWAFQVQFVMVYFFAHASFAALLQATGEQYDSVPPRERWLWLGMSVLFAWLSTYSMSNGLLVWPLLVLLAAALELRRRSVVILVANGAIAWFVYLAGLGGTGSLVDGLYHLPKSLTYALVVLGLPIDETASALMQTFGLPAPPYPGLGGDALSLQSWRPFVAATAGLLGLGYFLRLGRRALDPDRLVTRPALVLLFCVLFLIGTTVLIGLGRSPRFDVVAVMQSRYSTPALLFWACLGLLFLAGCGTTPADRGRLAAEARLNVVLGVAVLTVAINQTAMLPYVKGYRDYLGEVEQAVAANVYNPEIWARVNYDPKAMIPVVDYFRQNRLSVFATKTATWTGQLVGTLFTLSDGCVGHVDEIDPLPSEHDPGIRVRGWAWDDRDHETADVIVITDQDGRIVGLAETVYQRDDVTGRLPGRVLTPWVGWRGFAPMGSVRLDAYLVRDEDATACKVGELASSQIAPR